MVRREGPHRGKQVAKVVKNYVNRRISGNMENKYLMTSSTNLVVGNTIVITDISAMAQGDNKFQRDGDAVAPQSLEIRVNLQANLSAVRGAIRVFVLSTRVEGTPALGDFLDSTSFPLAMIAPIKPPPHLQKVLYDRYVTLDTDTSTGSRAKHFIIRLDKRKLPARIEYDNGATTAPKNKLFLVMIGHDDTNKAVRNMFSKFVYKDV